MLHDRLPPRTLALGHAVLDASRRHPDVGAVVTLLQEAQARGVIPPTERTLAQYGLTTNAWIKILKRQGWVCPICLKTFTRWNTDHDHVPGWKKKSDAERARHVRGVLCWYCNRKVVGDKRSSEQAQRVADYLKAHEERMTS